MKKVNIFSVIILIAMIALISAFLTNCNQSDDDDDQSGDDDKISPDGCHYVINEADENNKISSQQTIQTADFEDCIPQLPDEDLRASLIVLLSAYLGNYVDDNGDPKQILCRPEGEWILPYREADLFCSYWYEVPVWVVVDETGATVEGKISNDDAPAEELLERSGFLRFFIDNVEYYADHNRYSEIIQWQFWGPDGPPYWGGEYIYNWTKVE